MKIKLIHLNEIDSTSTYMQQLFREEREKPPLAIAAEKQSKGRGRFSRSWESPEGNLYISFGFKLEPSHFEKLTLLPIYTGILVADWIKSLLSLRVTLKWPNDILFGGRKIGGILCESSMKDGKIDEVILGIGININSFPHLPGVLEAFSLEAIVRDSLSNSRVLAESLVEYFGANWDMDQVLNTIERFWDYGIERGQLWVDIENQVFKRSVGLDKDGSMLLKEIGSSKSGSNNIESVSNINHNYSWIYQGSLREKYPILVADLGNTRFKIGVYKNNSKAYELIEMISGTYDESDLSKIEHLKDRLASYGISEGCPIHMAPVNSDKIDLFKSSVEAAGFRVVSVPKRPVRVNFDKYKLEEMGIDRVALCEAAFYQKLSENSLQARANTKSALIIIGVGTATTIDCIEYENGIAHYLGGYITLGLKLKFKTLFKSASLLPDISIDSAKEYTDSLADNLNKSSSDPLGHTTKEAITYGAAMEVKSLVDNLSNWCQKTRGVEDVSCCLTGGDANLISSLMDIRERPDIVLQGICIMAQGGI